MNVAEIMSGSPYVAYGYSYPHKTAYRPLSQPERLREVWAEEEKDSLFLYIHVPFCHTRCGFCNLFTTSRSDDLREQYLTAVRRQAEITREELGSFQFARLAIGGGTPTVLNAEELEQLLQTASRMMGVRPESIPTSVEVSPSTVSRERLEALRAVGVKRISIGVQVFDDAEVRALGRAQTRSDVHRALTLIREMRFPTLNLDLIYGGDGQTVETWMTTLEEALTYAPEEIYLYPLYVRPLTGLGLAGKQWDDQRQQAYRAGRDFLKSRGYRQVSMRMFRAAHAETYEEPVYCCQTDGMVGLGAGARSYTRNLHYSTDYAVGINDTREIVTRYIGRTAEDGSRYVDYGFRLDGEERRRRFLTKSLLQCRGLDKSAYKNLFGTDCLTDFPELHQLQEVGLADIEPASIRLTEAGLELSDAIAPWLRSNRVRRLMESYVWR